MDITQIPLSGLSASDRASQLATQTSLERSQQAAQADTSAAQSSQSGLPPTQRLPDLSGAQESPPEGGDGDNRGRNLDVYA